MFSGSFLDKNKQNTSSVLNPSDLNNYLAVIHQSVLHVILPQIAQMTLISLLLSLVYQRQCRR